MTAATEERSVRQLARTVGIELSYVDVRGTRRHAGTDALVAVLGAMGTGVERPADAPDALRRRQATTPPLVEPTTVAWDGRLRLRLRPDPVDRDAPADLTLHTEDGREHRWRAPAAGVPIVTDGLVAGVHQLEARVGGRVGTTRVVAAPRRVHGADETGRTWGLGAPLWALRPRAGRPIADLADLETLGRETVAGGGRILATLPLLPTYTDPPADPGAHPPADPSPYLPVSRLHWHEAWLAPTRVPELEGVDLPRPGRTSGGDLVQWDEVARWSRAVLDEIVDRLSPARQAACDRFLVEHPDVVTYARGRGEREGDGARAVRRHEVAQWLLRDQLGALRDRLADDDAGLYLDLPLGCHPRGHDVRSRPELFATGVSVGAPPDDFQPRGQRWGFPPLRPDASRADAHGYFADALAHQMQVARWLRLDHVMGLHHLFWVPDGFEAVDGVYVRSPADELWARVTLASHRHRCAVVGEDLGTVPRAVRRALAHHGVLGTWVAQFDPTLSPPARAMAAVGTHDLPPAATWWRTRPAPERAELARHLGLAPGASWDEAGPALLRHLGASEARAVLVDLADLWRMEQPYNDPGTPVSAEHPNWRRRLPAGAGTTRRAPLAPALGDLHRKRRPDLDSDHRDGNRP